MNLDTIVILIIVVSSNSIVKRICAQCCYHLNADFLNRVTTYFFFYHTYPRDELEIVEAFTSSLPAEIWVGCKFQMLNRPTAPLLVLLFKK
jgi:hypothetical protein